LKIILDVECIEVELKEENIDRDKAHKLKKILRIISEQKQQQQQRSER
jgi:hypothetical protein